MTHYAYDFSVDFRICASHNTSILIRIRIFVNMVYFGARMADSVWRHAVRRLVSLRKTYTFPRTVIRRFIRFMVSMVWESGCVSRASSPSHFCFVAKSLGIPYECVRESCVLNVWGKGIMIFLLGKFSTLKANKLSNRIIMFRITWLFSGWKYTGYEIASRESVPARRLRENMFEFPIENR